MKYGDYHRIILDDDGIPDLYGAMRKFKFEIDKLYDVDYKSPKKTRKIDVINEVRSKMDNSKSILESNQKSSRSSSKKTRQ